MIQFWQKISPFKVEEPWIEKLFLKVARTSLIRPDTVPMKLTPSQLWSK